MKRSLRIFALLIVLFTVLSLFCACLEPEETVSKESEASKEEKDPSFYGYDYPSNLKYGRTVKVLTTSTAPTATCYQIKPESNPDYKAENMTAVLNSASEATKLVEELMDIEVEEECIFTSSRYGGEMYQRISRDALSYTADYLVTMPCLNEAAMLAAEGLLYDLNDIVNLENPWWCKPFNDSVTIAGKTFFASGDYGTISMESTMFVAFNKELESSFGLAKGLGYESLYEMVDKMAWTQDVMFEMAKTVFDDSNGNQKADPEDNLIGLSAQDNVVYWLLRAGGVKVCSVNGEGYPELTVNSERSLSLINNAQENLQDSALGLIIADDYLSKKLPINPATQVFIDGKCLFYFNSLSNLNIIRVMEDDFGVLPCPIYDDTQDNYNNNVGSWTSNCVAVPTSVSSDDIVLAGHFLNALGAVSRATLTPVFYEQTLQYQISRDDDSMRMLDIITENRTPELAEMYRWGDMMSTIAWMRKQPVGTFASAYQRIEDKTIDAIEKTVEAFKKQN